MPARTFACIALALATAGCSIDFEMRLGDTGSAAKPAGAAATSPGSKSGTDPAKPGSDKPDDKAKKAKTIEDVVGKDKKIPGLFTLYQNTTNGAVHLVVAKNQLDREYVYFTYTVDGPAAAGHFRGAFRDNRVFSLRKHFNRIELISENTAFYFAPSNALSRAATANISPAILASQEIVAEDTEQGLYLIKADALFLTEALHPVKPPAPEGGGPPRGFRLGSLGKDKTKYLNLRNYPKNTDVLVEYVYENPSPSGEGGDDITDARNVSIRMQHTLIEMPQNDYKPRLDDARVGYFTERVTDLTSPSATPYRDLIHRWHLVKKDPKATLSEPVEPIVWWIENTTPLEWRDTIRDAALAWNPAFEASGFKNALVVKVQPDDADWDAGDIRYNVLRWTSSPDPQFGGYGPSFVNPRTGQILGADVMLEYIFLTRRLQLERIFESAGLLLGSAAEKSPLALLDQDHAGCTLGFHLHQGSLFGLHALTAAGAGKIEVTQMLKEAVFYLILHELGHTLGLNHNMRSSQMLALKEVQDAAVARQRGLTGSVMDYPPVNLAAPGQTQGLYYTTITGPYDRWAIEFGYAPSLDDPAAERARVDKLLARSTEPALAFGNDADDMRAPGKAIDPRVMVNDMSADAIGYAAGRIALAKETLRKLKPRFTVPNQSYHELRSAYLTVSGEYAGACAVLSRYVGGIYLDRATAGQPGATRPFTPVPADDQKRALRILAEELFAPTAFDAAAELYDHLQMQRRGFEFIRSTEDPKIHQRALAIQAGVLDHLLHPVVLARLSDTRLYGNTLSPLALLDSLTPAIIEDPLEAPNTFRQNLQLEYVRRLIAILGKDGSSPYDPLSRSAALAHLQRIEKQVRKPWDGPRETAAHGQHLLFLVDKALNAD